MQNNFPKNSEVPVVGRFRSCLRLLEKYNLKGKVLLDVGSSTGLLESKLKRRGLKKMIGIEPNKEAVEFARKTVKDAEFHIGTADNLLVKNNTCDIVTMFDVIEHIPENGERDAFFEVKRVLKKGGNLFTFNAEQ
jgi:ubiquinone/menaquinone biosynthesis C-methylase UbiE